MASIFTMAVVGLLIVNLSMFTSFTSARPLERLERQTIPEEQQFSFDTKLHFGLDVLESTACPAGGSNWLEVANICEVIQSLDELEQRLNVVSEDSSINSTATEIKSLMCNKLQDIITESFIVSLAPDCSDEKLEVVCARAPICRDAMEARHTLQANPSTDQTSQWINDHIEEEGSVKTFICRSNQLPC